MKRQKLSALGDDADSLACPHSLHSNKSDTVRKSVDQATRLQTSCP